MKVQLGPVRLDQMKTFTLNVLEHSGCRYLPLKSSSFLYEKKYVEFN